MASTDQPLVDAMAAAVAMDRGWPRGLIARHAGEQQRLQRLDAAGDASTRALTGPAQADSAPLRTSSDPPGGVTQGDA